MHLPSLTLLPHLLFPRQWHLGHSGGDGRPGGGYHPTWRGYDSYVGVPYSIDMGCSNTPLSENGTAIHGCPDSGAVNSTDSPAIPLYNSTAPHCSGETCSADVIQQPADLTTLDDHYVQHVSDFLALHAAGGPRAGRPFFAYVPFSHTHVPLSHNPRFQNKSRVNTLFGDTLLEMDDTFGRIMKALEQASLDTDTLVLVVGDNVSRPLRIGSAESRACGRPLFCAHLLLEPSTYTVSYSLSLSFSLLRPDARRARGTSSARMPAHRGPSWGSGC